MFLILTFHRISLLHSSFLISLDIFQAISIKPTNRATIAIVVDEVWVFV